MKASTPSTVGGGLRQKAKNAGLSRCASGAGSGFGPPGSAAPPGAAG